ncbi:hypothetical protein DFH28DRAFT_924695 [Melampsora americana]|nr:hypothetical protein DFH28DRAFT_924695 [Melampsora americana]
MESIKKLTVEQSQNINVLSALDKAVILVDLAGQLLAINLPPKYPSNTLETTAGHMTPEALALKAFEGASGIHRLPTFQVDLEAVDPSETGNSNNQFETDCIFQGRSTPVPSPGALYKSHPYVAYGYSLGTANSNADTKVKLGFESWIIDKLHWTYQVLHALNTSVNPETFKVAEQVVGFIEEASGPFVAKHIKELQNKVIQAFVLIQVPWFMQGLSFLSTVSAQYCHLCTHTQSSMLVLARLSAARNGQQFSNASM